MLNVDRSVLSIERIAGYCQGDHNKNQVAVIHIYIIVLIKRFRILSLWSTWLSRTPGILGNVKLRIKIVCP